MRYARIVDGSVVELRNFSIAPDPNPAKGLDWRACPPVALPSFNHLTHKISGPTYVVDEMEVTEEWGTVALTAQEISDKKDAAVGSINGNYTPLLKILLVLVNDLRATRGKINDLIDATGQSGAVTKYQNNQTTQINIDQLKTAIKAEL